MVNDNSLELNNGNSSTRQEKSKATGEHQEDGRDAASKQRNITDLAGLNLTNLIGEFGYYQLSLSVLAFIRYVCVAMMTNSGTLLAPTLEFWCQPTDSNIHEQVLIDYPINATSREEFLKGKCYLEGRINSAPSLYKCENFRYNTNEYGITLTDTFKLNCNRDWYRSVFSSTVSCGVVVASIVFGSFSDENGRKLTIRICCLVSLLAGSLSVVAPNFLTYTLSRSLCSMSDLGIVGSLYTIIVETLGNKYRGTVCIIVFTGWSMGVMIMPWITEYFMDFRRVMLFTVVCHIATLPWLLTIGESIRWLLINGHFDAAQDEVLRINRMNLGPTISSEAKQTKLQQVLAECEKFKSKFRMIVERRIVRGEIIAKHEDNLTRKLLRSFFGGLFKVGQIFRSRELTITTATLVWATFNSEFMYMLFIMINSDVGDDVKLNYAIGGVMEVLATLIAVVMIDKMRRRISLCSTLLIISASVFCLAFTNQHPAWSIPVLNFTKLAVSTLSSLIYVIATELFPTSLRQTGMGLAATLGSTGAVLAPFARKELTDAIGMTNVMLALFLLPLSAAISIPLFLRETKDVELPDDIDEITDGVDPSVQKPDGPRDIKVSSC